MARCRIDYLDEDSEDEALKKSNINPVNIRVRINDKKAKFKQERPFLNEMR